MLPIALILSANQSIPDQTGNMINQQPQIWTPEGVLIFIGIGFIGILLTIISYLGHKQLDLSHKQLKVILERLDKLTDKQANCRESLPGRFADKVATALDIKELYKRTDRHEKKLERHSTLFQGRRANDDQTVVG